MLLEGYESFGLAVAIIEMASDWRSPMRCHLRNRLRNSFRFFNNKQHAPSATKTTTLHRKVYGVCTASVRYLYGIRLPTASTF